MDHGHATLLYDIDAAPCTHAQFVTCKTADIKAIEDPAVASEAGTEASEARVKRAAAKEGEAPANALIMDPSKGKDTHCKACS